MRVRLILQNNRNTKCTTNTDVIIKIKTNINIASNKKINSGRWLGI